MAKDETSSTAATGTGALPEAQDVGDRLRFITCGAVGDGKSTLLGSLLDDSKTVSEDHQPFAAQTERAQGIAIDVSYRYFETDKRKFAAADAPGYEEHTRNIAGGASTTDLAIVVVDARKGVVNQTRRHSYVVSLFGIRQILLAVNKMDLVGYDQDVFDAVTREYISFAGELGIKDVRCVPVSALTGANVSAASGATPWYAGPPLMKSLETIEVLRAETHVSHGDTTAERGHAPDVADQFAAHVIWMDAEAMLPKRSYTIRFARATAIARVTDLVHRIDANTLDHLAAKTLELNEVGYCKLALDRAVAFDAYSDNRQTGAFVLIDKFTNATVGAGVIDFALRRASNIAWHDMKVDKAVRARANSQKPCVLWFTGLSGAGKSTIADGLEQKLHALGKRTYLLDGDNVRHGLNKDLGFTDQDRVENIRRVAEVSKLLVDAGLIVIVSFISPFRAERQMARAMMEEDEFIEIFVDTPLEVCEVRDTKGLYKKARAGELKNFTGIDSDYETPLNAEITLRTTEADPAALVDQVIEHLSSAL